MKKKVLLTIFGISFLGFLIGGAGVDSEQWEINFAVMISSLVIAMISYTYYEICEKRVENIKQPKKLSLQQKKILSECGLRPQNWMLRFEDRDYLHVVHKTSGSIRIIDKAAREVIRRHSQEKEKAPSWSKHSEPK